MNRRLISLGGLAIACALLAGFAGACGSGSSATNNALLYMVFDLSDSYTEQINEEHAETATFLGSKFCGRHKESGKIMLSGITATSEADAVLTPIACPACKNETQCKSALLGFEPQLRAAIGETTAAGGLEAGSDVIGALHYAGRIGFARTPSSTRYLVVFSDMQHSGDNVRNCIRSDDKDPKICLGLYYKAHPDVKADDASLKDVSAYVIGFGRNRLGSLSPDERRNYKTLWRTFLKRQQVKICWFDAGFPVGILPDGTRGISDEDFRPDCTVAPI